MSTFKEIQGRNIRSYTNNAPNATAGEMWYNRTELKLKGVVASGAWSSSASATNSPRIFSAGDGPVTAGWMAGGGSASPNDIASTEEYNGSGWAAGGDLPGATYGAAGVGPQTAGLIFGGNNGSILATAYEYNGTAWGSPTSMPTGRNYVNRAGTQTSALAFGGSNPGPTSNVATSEYDGSSWTAGGNLPVGIEYAAGTGTQTAALAAGGYHQPGGTTEPTATLYYDGSAWTSAGTLPEGRYNTQAFGIQTDAIVAAGFPSPRATTSIKWNGTSWSANPSLATPRNGGTSMGQNGGATSSGWVCGGQGVATEEFNFTANTVTAAAWSSGGALPQGVSYNSGAGTQTAALSIGGQQPSTSAIANTYEYNGSSWSEGGPIAAFFGSFPTPTSSYYFGAAGTQTAALIVGGAETNNRTVEYNGSSWTQTGNYPSQISQSTMNGIQTAAINISGAGSPPGYTGVVANYNGSSWTASPVAFSPAGRRMSSAGTYTATIVSGGSNTGTITSAQEWDGSSWTTVGAPNAPKNDAKSTGIQTAALKMHGGGTESYDGSSWATAASMANNRSWCTGGSSNDASNTSAVVFGGSTPSFTSATEEFTGETTSLNIVDITTS